MLVSHLMSFFSSFGEVQQEFKQSLQMHFAFGVYVISTLVSFS